MFAVSGRVTRMPSAWRGDATELDPKRLESKTTLPSALTSTSQPLQPAGADLAQAARASEQPPQLPARRLDMHRAIAGHHQPGRARMRQAASLV